MVWENMKSLVRHAKELELFNLLDLKMTVCEFETRHLSKKEFCSVTLSKLLNTFNFQFVRGKRNKWNLHYGASNDRCIYVTCVVLSRHSTKMVIMLVKHVMGSLSEETCILKAFLLEPEEVQGT